MLDRPLEGMRVLAVENFLAGPFASMWLGDWGAEVVKVEEPGQGDHSRRNSPLKPDAEGTPQGLSFLRSNRNKRSLTLNLKSDAGRRTFLQLAGQADIVVENLRPGVMDKLGLGWAQLSEANPRLIYVAVSGYGHADVKASPYTDHPAFDIVAQARSGLMYRPERSGERPIYLGVSLGDILAGMHGAQGALLALLQRGRTGRGQKVDVSMVDSALVLNELPVVMYSVFKEKYPPGAHALTSPFGTYRAADGWIVIAVLGEHVWRRFCEALAQPQLADDERFANGLARRRHQAALDDVIDTWLATRTREQAVRLLLEQGVPAAPVNDVDDVLACPHVAARRMLVELDDPVWGPVQLPGNPIKLSDMPEDIPLAHPPRLGEHTDQVLSSWLGLKPEEIAALRDEGAA